MQKKSKRKTVPILMYHSISSFSTARFRPFTVSPSSFAEQMAYVWQEGYTPLTVTQWVNAMAMPVPTLPERPIILTFDDGFADFFTNVLPVLKQYQFTATLYVTTAFVGGTSRWLRREGEATRPMLTWEQLGEVQRSGVECGGHTHTHSHLDTLSRAAVCDEIVRCKDLLEQFLGQPVTSFAYPFGSYTSLVRQQVYEAGYTSACAVKHAMSSDTTDPLTLTRFMVTADTNLHTFARLFSGTGVSLAAALYLRTRTSIWQTLRRSASVLMHSEGGGILAI